MYDGYLRIKTNIDTKDFNAQISEVESELETLKRGFETTNQMPVYEGKNEDLQDLSLQIEKVTNKLVDLRSKQQSLDNKGFLDASKNIEKTSGGISKILKKLTKWGLALFGIRAMYGAIRQAVGIITQYDEQLGANLDYMKFALATTIKPLIEWLINAVYKLMTYVNYISQAWFGINLFKNAGVSEYNKAMNKANSETNKLKKTLAGFDEINMVNDSSSSSGSSGVSMPTYDFAATQIDVPSWVKWIANHKDEILSLAGVVGIAFGASAIGKALGNISNLFGSAGGKGLIGLAGSLSGIAAVAGSIAIVGYVAFSTWREIDNLNKSLDSIINKNAEMNKQWQESLDPVTDLNKELDTVGSNIASARDNIKKSNEIWHKESNVLGTIEHTWAGILGVNKKYFESAKAVAYRSDKILETLQKMYNAEGRTVEEKRKIIKQLQEQRDLNYDVIAQMNQQGEDTSYLKWITQEITNATTKYNKELDNTIAKTSGISSGFSDVKNNISNINDMRINDKSFSINGTTKINTSAIDRLMDKVLTTLGGLNIMGAIKTPVNAVKNMVGSFKNILGLASGGIVNMPGHGVPLSNVITGEAGREGVIPLTNPNAMAQLGQEIGKWVNINNTVNNYMDAKKINTILAQSSNQQNMLRNGV